MLNAKQLLLIACVSGFLAVALGAFGAHGLEHILTEKTLKTYHTAVEYQFYHTFALMLAGIFSLKYRDISLFNTAGMAFAAGIVIFSGSLYAYTLSGIKAFAMVTPIGGFMFMIGWILFFIAALKLNLDESPA